MGFSIAFKCAGRATLYSYGLLGRPSVEEVLLTETRGNCTFELLRSLVHLIANFCYFRGNSGIPFGRPDGDQRFTVRNCLFYDNSLPVNASLYTEGGADLFIEISIGNAAVSCVLLSDNRSVRAPRRGCRKRHVCCKNRH